MAGGHQMTNAHRLDLMTIRDSDWRRIYAMQHPLAIVVAATLCMTGVVLLLSPPLFAHSVVARALPNGLEYPWDITLIAGGLLTIWGYWTLSGRFEASGSIMLSTALFVWLFVYVAGDTGRPTGAVPVALALAVAVGMVARAYAVLSASPDMKPWLQRSR